MSLKNSSSTRDAIIEISIATIFFSLATVCVKTLTEIPTSQKVLFRGGVSLVLCYFWLRKSNISPWGTHKKLLLLRGLLGTLGLVLYFNALIVMPLASAVTIHALSPLTTILFSAIILKERVNTKQLLCFVVAFAGIALIKGFDPDVRFWPLVITVLSAFVAGAAYTTIRAIGPRELPLVVVFYFPLVTVPLIGPIAIARWVTPTLQELAILLGIGLFTHMAQVFMTRAFQKERAATVSIFFYMGIIYTSLYGYFIFGELAPPMAIAGMVLIIVAVILNTLLRKKQ